MPRWGPTWNIWSPSSQSDSLACHAAKRLWYTQAGGCTGADSGSAASLCRTGRGQFAPAHKSESHVWIRLGFAAKCRSIRGNYDCHRHWVWWDTADRNDVFPRGRFRDPVGGVSGLCRGTGFVLGTPPRRCTPLICLQLGSQSKAPRGRVAGVRTVDQADQAIESQDPGSPFRGGCERDQAVE